MRRIADMKIREGSLVDSRAICRDPQWQIRVCSFYEIFPVGRKIPTGIQFSYLEKWTKNNKDFYKLFFPETISTNEIPFLEWDEIHQNQAIPISVIVPLEKTKYKSILENMPEFPCRICKFKDQEKNDLCVECNRIVRYYMGACKEKYPKIPIRLLRESIVKKLGDLKIDEFTKSI